MNTEFIKIAIYNILYVNDLACACVVDMEDKVKSQDKETQKIFGALKKRMRRYERTIMEILGDKMNFLAEYNFEMDEKVHDKVSELYSVIFNFLKEKKVDNCEFIALSSMAYTMIGYSIVSIDHRIEELIKTNKDITNMENYKLTEMLRISKNLCDWVSRKCDNINLNDSEIIKSSYQDLDKALTNCMYISDSIHKASTAV